MLKQITLYTLTAVVFFATGIGLTAEAEASHIRYGYLSWEYLGENNGEHEVAISLTMGLRISFYGNLEVGDPVTGTLPTLHFGDGSSAGFEPMEVIELHEDDDWFLARRTLTHSYDNEGPYLAYLEQSGWRLGGNHINNSHGTIRMETVVDVSEGSGSATSGLPPIIDCEWGEDCTFTVPANDPDGDDVFFRMATSEEAGGSSTAFDQPNNAEIDGSTGGYTWSAGDQPGSGNDGDLYSTQIIMEKDGGNTRSSIDFFIRLLEDPDPLPEFSEYMLPSGIDLTVKAGSALDIWAEASNGEAPEARFSISGVGVPPEAGFPSDSGNPAGGLFTWTPKPEHTGSHTMNIIAENEAGQSIAPHNIGFNVSAFEEGDIRVAKAAYHLEVGQTHQSIVQRLDAGDEVVDITGDATFEISADSPSDDSVLSVDSHGLVSAETPGYAKMLVTANGHTIPAFITVSGVHPDSIPVFDEENMLPENPGDTIVVPAGEELILGIVAGAKKPSEDITLLDDSSPLVEIPFNANFPGAQGNPALADFTWTPTADDAATHTLRFEAENEYGITRSHTIDVLVQVEDDIRFTQWSFSFGEGTTTSVVVEQLQSDGTYEVVTDSASITSNDTSVVTVDGDQLTGTNLGSTTIVADVDGNQIVADVTVTEAPPEATVKFDSQDGEPVDPITQDVGSDVEVPAGPDRTGYTLVNWNTQSDGTGNGYAPGDTFEMPAGGKTLYAQWEINQYTVDFDSHGGKSVPSITQDYDTTVTVPSGPSRTGYTFAGWNTGADGAGTSYEPGDTFSMPAQDMTLHAQWNINQYTVSFDSRGGSGVASITQDFDSTVTIPSDPSRTGYSFVEWNTESDGTGTGYTASDSFSMPAGDKTLYAQWSINSYTVSFDSQGGSAVDDITDDYNTRIELPAAPQHTGYSFKEWNTVINGSGRSYDVGGNYRIPATNTTLYAQWEVITYTVTYEAGPNGTIDGASTQTVQYGEDASSIEAVPSPGYHFSEWSDGVTDNPRTDTNLTSDLEVSATFDAGERHLNLSGFDSGIVGEPVTLDLQLEDGMGTSLALPVEVTVEINGDGWVESTTLAGADTGVATTSGQTSSDGAAELEIFSETSGPLEICVFTSATAEPYCKTVELSPQEAEQLLVSTPESSVTVGTPVTTGLQLADQFGNPVADEADIEFSVSGSAEFAADASSTIKVTTNPQTGYAEATMTNTVAESVTLDAQTTVDSKSLQNTLDFIFQPGPAHRLAITAEDEMPNACEEAELTIVATDSYGNHVDTSEKSVEVTLTASSQQGSPEIAATDLEDAAWEGEHSVTGRLPAGGSASLVVVLDAADTLELDWSSPDLAQETGETDDELVSFQTGPVDTETSEVLSSGSQIYAGTGTLEVTVIARDACGLALGDDHNVTLEPSFGTVSDVEYAGDGRYIAEFSTPAGECPDEPATIDASVDGELLNGWVEITSSCAEVATDSSVSLTPESSTVEACPANGAFAQIQVVPITPSGHSLPPGQDVQVVDNPPYLVAGDISEQTDGESGETEYTVAVGSNRCSGEPYSVQLKVGGVTLNTEVEIEFECPTITDDGVRFAAAQDEVTSGEVDVHIELEDTCGNPGFGRQINVEAFGDMEATVAPETTTTVDAYGESDDGVATVTVLSDEAGQTGLRVEIMGNIHDSAADLLAFATSSEPVVITTSDPESVSGTGEPGATVVIEVDGEEVAHVEVDDDGNWSWEPDEPLEDGQSVSAHELGHQGSGDAVTVAHHAAESGCGCMTSQSTPPLGNVLLALGVLFLLALRRRSHRQQRQSASLRRA